MVLGFLCLFVSSFGLFVCFFIKLLAFVIDAHFLGGYRKYENSQTGINYRLTTGSPSSKYEHRRALALLHSILYKELYGEKTYRFCSLRR